MLREWSRWFRQFEIPGHIEVEANASGFGGTYNRELALRRAEALRQILVQNGFAAREIEIRVQDWFGRHPGSHHEDAGNVRVLNSEPPITDENGPATIIECF